MSRKPKFKPVISRIKLNPEQAVLSCNCYNSGGTGVSGHDTGAYNAHICVGAKGHGQHCVKNSACFKSGGHSHFGIGIPEGQGNVSSS